MKSKIPPPKLKIQTSRNYGFQRGTPSPNRISSNNELQPLNNTAIVPKSATHATKSGFFFNNSMLPSSGKPPLKGGKYRFKSPQPRAQPRLRPINMTNRKNPVKKSSATLVLPKINFEKMNSKEEFPESGESELMHSSSANNSPLKPENTDCKLKFMWKGGPKTGGLFIPTDENLLYSIRALRLCYRSNLVFGKSKLIHFNKSLGGEGEKKLKILILDLDQTLVYEMSHENMRKSGKIEKSVHKLKLSTPMAKKVLAPPEESKKGYPMLVRPYLKKFLYNMKPFYEIVIFSTQDREYVKRALDKIDPEGIFISGFLCSENLSELEVEEEEKVIKVKSLKAILGADKKDCVILDDTMHLWPFDLDNLIVAEPYTGDIMDTFLPRITHFLMKLATTEDLSKEIKIKSREIFSMKRNSAS